MNYLITSKKQYKTTVFTILMIILPAIYIQYNVNIFFRKKSLDISMQELAANYDAKFLKLLSMGNRRLISSILWIQTLIESDIEHYKKRDLNSWLFLRFDSITSIDPNFYEAYLFGGQYLSVVKDDDFGAEKILLKGLEVFPKSFRLNYYMGFHYYFELYDFDKAYIYYHRILNHSKASRLPWLTSTVARLTASKGDLNASYDLIRIAYDSAAPDSVIKKKLGQHLYAIKAELDLRCLNDPEGAGSCPYVDFYGNAYIKNEVDGSQYKAQREWKNFRPFKKK
ncbi:MAG: hypothetical protein ISR65_04040 [Bacteriovoracaceae bacterium]|nr:hypothetical protein [Bacteriovoracaceae bacterium]